MKLEMVWSNSLWKPIANTIKKAEFIKKIERNDDVQFYWCIISADFEIDDTETHAILLEMIIELYVTIRGFSFAREWMEKYKQKNKKTTEKSTGLRRKLYDNDTDGEDWKLKCKRTIITCLSW